MIPKIITSFDVFKNITQNEQTLFWIIEYNPQTYNSPEDRYSILRNEILKHPQDYNIRLDNKIYRIWTVTPYEQPW